MCIMGWNIFVFSTVDDYWILQNEKGSKSKHHKKKSSRDKESSSNKEEKKGKKKKSSRRNNGSEGHDELEEFLNSHDTAYEAIWVDM